MLKQMETYKHKEITRLQTLIPTLTGIAKASAYSHIKTEQTHLKQIQKIKEKYPYLKTALTPTLQTTKPLKTKTHTK